jgi:hypothetical protein
MEQNYLVDSEMSGFRRVLSNHKMYLGYNAVWQVREQ